MSGFPNVEEVACIGVPDPEWGQEPVAVMVLKEGETATAEEILAYCKDRLAGFKRPKTVFFRDTLPRNQMGKVLKVRLRGEYASKA
jgi:acyl-CoA synthetase (AMP-forming)/AMP-acid ligase II